jgi:manganese/zinc/iron transport system permease protein
LTTFDAGLAAALGFSPVLVHYGLMIVVSVTAVGAFDAVGSILVVALMIAPPAAAYLLTDRLSRMLLYSAALAAAGAIGGFWLAWFLDANIAGSIAAVLGVIFLGAFLLAPGRGLMAQAARHGRQRWEFAQTALAIHLLNHENTPEMAAERRVDHLHYHLRWEPNFASTVVDRAERRGLVRRSNGDLELTPAGRERARTALVHG